MCKESKVQAIKAIWPNKECKRLHYTVNIFGQIFINSIMGIKKKLLQCDAICRS